MVLTKDSNEKSSLIRQEEGKRRTELPDPDKSDLLTSGEDEPELTELEKLLDSTGYGLFHLILMVVAEIAMASDAIEIFSVSFVLPVTEGNLVLTTARKGYLNAIIIVGMLIGGYLWGSLADVFGRRRTLVSAMLLNGVFSLVAAFSPNYYSFLFFRFTSGIGVGGSIPVVFSYVVEFFTERKTGPLILLLSLAWPVGLSYTAFLAWGLLGTTATYHSVNFYIGSLHFATWRLFLIICTIPAFLSAFFLLFMTETPAFLYQEGKLEKFSKVLQIIHLVNSACSCCCYSRHRKDHTNGQITNGPVSIELTTSSPQHTQPPSDKLHGKMKLCLGAMYLRLTKIYDYFNAVVRMSCKFFKRKYLRATLLLTLISFTLHYGTYGMQLWFPEYFKRLASHRCNETEENIIKDCINHTSLHFYEDTVYTDIASIPGCLLGILLINILGGRILLFAGNTLSAVSMFVVWSIPGGHDPVVAISAMFNALTSLTFGGLNVAILNIYSTSVRSTALGFIHGIGRIGIIFASVTFGYLLDVDKTVPILIVASFLTVGAVSAIFLPPIYRPENRPPLVRIQYKLKTWLCLKCCKK